MAGQRLDVVAGLFGFAFFGAMGAASILDWYNDTSDWCALTDVNHQCFREWVGATSGWAAAIAAAISIIFLVRQTTHASRQTDFMIGDTSPSAAMFDPEETNVDNAFSNRLEIINWNRHPILINGVELLGSNQINLYEVKVNHSEPVTKNRMQRELQRGRMRIPGWLNRSDPPSTAVLELIFSSSDPVLRDTAENGLVRGDVDVRIAFTVAGARYEQATLSVSRNDGIIVVE